MRYPDCQNIMKKKNKKKKTFHALNPYANPKVRREFIDVDYVDKLSDKEKEWLNKFMDEYNGANLDFENPRKNLHKTKAVFLYRYLNYFMDLSVK